MNPQQPHDPVEPALMARAIELARRGLYSTDPNPRVGCVIVQGGRIVGEGWHQRAGEPHAEVIALQEAGAAARDADVYVSLEPCSHHGKTPPCSQALIQAGVRRVIAAMEDPNPRVAGSGLKQLGEAGIETACGLLGSEAEALNPGFCQRMRTGRPWIRSKLAMSLDGRTAMASGESRWITGPEARRDVHALRARSSAIITGIGTVLADDPELTARLDAPEADIEQPVRVILDSHLRCPPQPRMTSAPGRSVILTTVTADPGQVPTGFEIVTLPAGTSGRLDLGRVIAWLGAQEFNEVLFEAGPTLNGALLAENRVDEWIVYLAPVVLGDGGRGLFHLPQLTRMADRIGLQLLDQRRVGGDLRLRLRPSKPAQTP
ncbi:MAG: bifunctional diaminohydroxyphosphoribosylaminopyrimidine deaminase/5-amino-6-(5-phosphoribosylamino)uracil reductase RibD [Methylococcus sp.]|nr:MAG: bifunctional diaminohydroxyphosphoribosylaminopyrimidine deaminase/5-amino-6-(5-phosphoribosylamino)uracil reductase RibD [Methylococcus sp.]